MSERTDRLKFLGEIALAHWSHRVNGAKLDVSVERPMAGSRGQTYRADIVLEDRETGFPRVAYVVLEDPAQAARVPGELALLNDTGEFLRIIDGSAPGPLELRVLAPKRLQADAVAAIKAAAVDAQAEVY